MAKSYLISFCRSIILLLLSLSKLLNYPGIPEHLGTNQDPVDTFYIHHISLFHEFYGYLLRLYLVWGKRKLYREF